MFERIYVPPSEKAPKWVFVAESIGLMAAGISLFFLCVVVKALVAP